MVPELLTQSEFSVLGMFTWMKKLSEIRVDQPLLTAAGGGPQQDDGKIGDDGDNGEANDNYEGNGLSLNGVRTVYFSPCCCSMNESIVVYNVDK